VIHYHHDYYPERNLICNLCEQLDKFAKTGQMDLKKSMFNTYPKLADYIEETVVEIRATPNYCYNRGLCRPGLTDESLYDGQIHIDAVNQANTTWTAGKQARFEGMTVEQIKRMLGTIVDPNWVRSSEPKLAETGIVLP